MSLLLGFLFIQDQLAFNSMNRDECTTAWNILKLVSSTRLIIFHFVVIVEIWRPFLYFLYESLKCIKSINNETDIFLYSIEKIVVHFDSNNVVLWCNVKKVSSLHIVSLLISKQMSMTSCNLNNSWTLAKIHKSNIDNKSNNTTCVCFEFQL